MKKFILSVLSMALFFCMIGCDKAEQTETTEVTTTTTEATTEATTETTTETKPSWGVNNVVDDFGDPTDDLYMYCIVSGHFSNTATTNEDLTVGVIFIPLFADPDDFSSTFKFNLLEYNDHPATYTKDEEFILKVKIGDEIYEEKLYSFPPNGSLCIFNALSGLHSEILPKIVDELGNGNVVRCIIESKSSKYEFEINSDGWQEAMEEMKKHYWVGQTD